MKNIFQLIHNRKFKIIILLTFLLTLYIFINAYCYVNQVSYDLQESVFRLHIIANSDSEEDQNLKYTVRDNLIQYMNSICNHSTSKEETIEIVSAHLSDFANIANQTIKDNGYSYDASVELGTFEFPTKVYADISFPAGYYDALKVEIGESQGQNWWCVLYPSLCFVNVTSGIVPDESKEELQESLTEEEYQIISDHQTPSIQFKFKLIEFFTKNNLLTAKNQ